MTQFQLLLCVFLIPIASRAISDDWEESDSTSLIMESMPQRSVKNASIEFRGTVHDRRNIVDKLGSILKRRVTRLRQESEIDLVFLVDSSASVGSQNFANEIKFVRKVSTVNIV